jgi:putative hydrolase of the HAD superfamily
MDSDTKAVVLDIDGTLCSLTRGIGEIYADLLGGSGLALDPVALSHCAVAEWREFQPTYLNVAQNYQTNPERERWVWHEYVRGVLTRAGLATANQPKVVERIYEAFSTKDHRAVTPGAIEFLSKARMRGLRVIAATNNDDRSKRVLLELGVAEYLEGIFCAGELGWKKPSVEFFRALEGRLGLKSFAILHVGNDPTLDIEPARRAGWSTILFGEHDGSTGSQRAGTFSALERALHL